MMKKYISAVALFSLVLFCGSPKVAMEHYNTGKAHYSKQRLKKAIQSFEASVAADSELLQARIMLGKTYFFDGQYKKAESVLRKISTEYPANAFCHLLLARIQLLKGGDEEIVRDHLVTAIQLDDKNFEAHYYLAKLYEKKNKIKDSLIEYNRAAAIQKEFYKIHYDLGRLYEKNDFPDRARKEYARLPPGFRTVLTNSSKNQDKK